MPKPDFTLKIIKDAGELRRLSDRLVTLRAFALDIETTEWWNRHRERVALVQIAFRAERQIKVFIIDALACFDLEPLRPPLEKSAAVKIIHNAGFDAARLNKHYDFSLDPVFDTMLAARRSGERKYSLKAQAETHLALRLDKSARNSDWSRRPLDNRQVYYAALDAFATLLLYENQAERGLSGGGDYRLKSSSGSTQNLLPLDDLPPAVLPEGSQTSAVADAVSAENSSPKFNLSEVEIAVLGIVAELPTRYSPDALAASTGIERVGLAGWIIDRRLGADAEPDEEEIKMAINNLCDRGLVKVTETRRLESTSGGERLWRKIR
jgi:DNA polymerase III epsilon subunit-like protein